MSLLNVNPPGGPARPGGQARPEDRFTAAEMAAVARLNRILERVPGGGGLGEARREAQRLYLDIKARVAARTGRFGIVNNRLFRGDGGLVVPYLAGDTLIVHRVENGQTRAVLTWRFPFGTLITDRLLNELTPCGGEVIDLEKEIFDLDVEPAVEIRIHRLRDMGALLARVNEITNHNEVVYALRFLVAQLCSPSFRGFLGAKNLKPEVRGLIAELTRFVNTRAARRVPLLVRILVRNVSGLVVRPGLIDRLWNDAIEAAETIVRGSALTAELRRSTHHALGDRTLRLARSYRRYLATGEAEELTRLGYPSPGAADEAARGDPAARRILDRMVEDLERLLGTSEVLEQVRDWQREFRAALQGTEDGKTVVEEGEVVIEQGIRARNRWVYAHHLRLLRHKVQDFAAGPAGAGDVLNRLDGLLAQSPDAEGFDAAAAEAEVRAAVAAFAGRLRAAYEDDLFPDVEMAVNAHAHRAFYETSAIILRLRRKVADRIDRGGFPALRFHLYRLDCLLEKMSYLALRHISTEYEEKGVRLRQCLEIIKGCILNLAHDGLGSREVGDLAGMLTDGNKTYRELSNVMEYLQRNYHKSLQHLTAPFAQMQQRLGLSDVELRMALANLQRYLHDHNSMVNFCDLARTFIRRHIAHGAMRVSRGPARPPEPDEAHTFLHLSDRRRIAALVARAGGAPDLRERYGGKGSGLLYLSHLNIPTRDGFILPTLLPQAGLHATGRPRLRREIVRHLRRLEGDIAARDGVHQVYGDPSRPMLLAVRGGSVFPMPGILSTAVFVGMNDEVAAALAGDDPWHAYDSYRRFLASYARAVWGFDLEAFDLVGDAKRKYGAEYKNALPWEAMKEISERSLEILRDEGHGAALDQVLADPEEQLFTAVQAVFNSWNQPRAQRYREIKGICHTWQTAVIVQQMACGNRRNPAIGPGMDERRASLTGVIPHTRLTDRGVRTLTGEIKFSAAGDDLVGGVTSSRSFRSIDELERLMPMLHRRLKHIVAKIIRFMGTDQEIEFTVERGVLSVLQSRAAEMGADRQGASFKDPGPEATRGIGIRGGGFRGVAAFDEADRKALAARGFEGQDDVDGVLMVVENPTPDDIPSILSADGLLTAKGGSSSHAAVAVNSLDDRSYSAVMSAAGLRVFAARKEAVILAADGGIKHCIRKGDVVSIHGTNGEVYVGSRELRGPE